MFSTTNRRHRRAQWVALGLFSIGLGLLASLGWPGLDLDGLWPPIWRSAVQAGLSATLSCLFGWLLAHSAIYARPQTKPRLWLALLNTIPVMPTLVVVLMLIAFYGRNGLLAQANLGYSGSIYSLVGVLAAHTFINAPWVMQQLLRQYSGLTQAQWQNAQMLGLNPARTFQLIDWPLIRGALLRQWGVVFLLCFTSFAVVLVLAGSPKWATLEVRLYQLLTLDFDISGAVGVAWIQVGLLLPMVYFLNRSSKTLYSLGAPVQRPVSNWGTGLWVLVSALWLGPMLALGWRAGQVDWIQLLSQSVLSQALMTSFIIGVTSAVMALILGWCLARARPGMRLDALGWLFFLVPSQVMALAMFLISRNLGWGSPGVAVWLSNTLMCLPFVLTLLRPEISRFPQDPLMDSLGLSGFSRWRKIHWPRHRHSLRWAFVFCFGLSLGDFGVVALFGSQDFLTLPYLLYQKLGSYRSQDAYALAMLMWLGLFLLFVSVLPKDANARR